MRVVAVLSITFVLFGSAPAAAAYRWEDERGNVHYAQTLDTVPPSYRSHAQQIASPPTPRPPANLTARSQGHPMKDACDPRAPLGAEIPTAMRSLVDRVYDRVFTKEVRADTGASAISLVIVDRPISNLRGPAVACMPGAGHGRSIVVTGDFLRRSLDAGELETSLARTLARELAHHALHGPGRRPLPEPEQREREADALGIYYYERAGYDCRDWAASATARDRDALRAACDLARRGARVR